MSGYPEMITPIGHVEPVPRRVRATLAGEVVLDTTDALYVWEWAKYPWFYIPLADVRQEFLVDEGPDQKRKQGTARRHALRVGEETRPHAAIVWQDDTTGGLANTVKFQWDALDSWFEEDEEIFVHPRNPYSRVDAIRSSRPVRIELDGVVLAESSAPVMVFETGLPTRYYLPRTALRLEVLEPSDTVTECPYKGRTSAYWSVRIGDRLRPDLAWSYDFPTRQLLPITGLVAFYNEKVDITIDGRPLERPTTHFS
jgi:uncharacterized protein (DUF427 family)